MIKQTFYNLPDEKRTKIVDVTTKEFFKGKKQKITINNVIKEAGISRGSFYQYFDDKLDLVEIVLSDMFQKITNFFKEDLIINKGDIFDTFIKVYDLTTANQTNSVNGLQTLDIDSNQNKDLVAEYMEFRGRKNNSLEEIINYIDRSSFKNKSNEDIECVVMMLFSVVKDSIAIVSKGANSIEKERIILIKKIDIIKNGATIH